MSRVFIGRHGEASFNAPSDRERPLTERGIKATRDLAERHKDAYAEVTEIWCSHLVRARETAAIYGKLLGLTPQPKDFLAPDCEPEEVLKELNAHQQTGDLMIVSHQPLVGDLVSWLCAGNVFDGHPYSTSEMLQLEAEVFSRGTAKITADFLPL